MSFVDTFLNRVTMYRVVLYYLTFIWVAALLLSTAHYLPFSPLHLLFSTVALFVGSWATQTVFATVFKAPANVESVYITAFILSLIISPVSPTDPSGVGFLLFASAWANASKYIFALGKKHLFNPAAFGIAAGAVCTSEAASWWVSATPLLPLVVLGGLLIARKIRRFDLVATFALVSLSTTLLLAPVSAPQALSALLLHTPLFFFALVMLTEPLTMPPTRVGRVAYAALVGILFAPFVHVGGHAFSPEEALLVGNVLVYVISPKGRYLLTLIERRLIATDTYELLFRPDRRFTFTPGQYVEWTLSIPRPDTRGNRRFFTIASSPTEELVKLGVKVYEPKSTFKSTLLSLREGDELSVSSLAGDFTLPTRKDTKLVFIAGGIGITPFRSMIQYLIDTNDTRDITLFYSNKTIGEIAYRDVFERAGREIGLKTLYALTNEPAPVAGTVQGFITADLIRREVPDYRDRLFYISGPHAMVEAFTKTLREMGVSRLSVKTDYFPGFV